MLSPDLKTTDSEAQTSFTSLEEELKKLREDKLILEGKIRGYLTLSEICHEYKEELRKLQAEYNKLLQTEQMKAQHLYSESPAPNHVDDLEPNNGPDLGQRTTKPKDPSNTALPNCEIARELARDKKITTNDLFDEQNILSRAKNDMPIVTAHSSFHSDAGKPGNTSLKSHEKFPMQESLAGEDMLNQSAGTVETSSSLTGLGFQHSSSGDMALGQSATYFNPRENRDLMNFSFAPSLNAKELNQTADVKLETVLKSIRQDMEDPCTGEKVAAVVQDYIMNLNKKIERLKKGNAVLIDQNTELKKKSQMMDNDYQLVLTRVRKLEQEKYELSRSRSPDDLQAAGWVQVEKVSKTEKQQTTGPVDDEAHRFAELQLHPNEKIDDLQWLQTHYRQLRDSNQKWTEEWAKLKQHYDQRFKSMEQERDELEKALTELKLEMESKRREYERTLVHLQEKASEEEKSKEEALLQLTTSNNRQELMQKQISELSDKVMVLKRDRQARDSEIQVLRQGINAARPDRGQSSRDGRSTHELQTEIDVLRQQLLVFQEDFDRERQDRATAQSLKDDYKKQNESYKKRVRHLEQKLAGQERQIKLAEETSQRTLTENQRLQQELTDLKNQHRRELEQSRMAAATYSAAHLQPPHMLQGQGMAPGPQLLYGASAGPPLAPQYMLSPQGYTQQMASPQYQGAFMAGSGAQTPTGHIRSQYTQAGNLQGPYNQGANQQGPYIQGANQGRYNQAANQQGPRATEHLPGSWPCNQCTYMNYPGRTVCEMCGYIQSPTTQNNFRYTGTGNDILMPRGDEQQRQAAQYAQYNYQPHGQNTSPSPGNRAV